MIKLLRWIDDLFFYWEPTWEKPVDHTFVAFSWTFIFEETK